MSSASIAVRLLRRAASSSPLSTLTRRAASSSATSRPLVPLFPFRPAAAASSSPGITARRFLALQSPASSSKTTADENLRRVIESEIDCIANSEEVSTQIDLPEDFPFEIIDTPGDQSITLKREFAGETIKAIVYTNFDNEDDLNEPDDSADENNQDTFKPTVQMLVTVEKSEGPILEFECIFNDDELAIENMRMLSRESCDDDNVYSGPAFSDLDESLQKSLHRYLEVRGIKHSLHDWLNEYMMCKDDKEYLVWLKNMKDFIGN